MSQKRQRASKISVRTLGARYPDGFVLDAHAHDDWAQLLYASEGVMQVETRSGAWVVPAHRAVWLPPGVRHRVTMRGSVALRTIYFARRMRASFPRATSVLAVSPLLRELLVYCARLGALDVHLAHHARLAGLIADLVSEVASEPLSLPSPREPRAAQIADAVRRTPADPASTEILARRAGLSVRTLERTFRAETGMTFGRWRQQARLLHALVLLAQGAPVSAVALDVGYASPSAFIAMFRATLGTTPSRYFAT